MTNNENFQLHLLYYISAILIGVLFCSAAKVSRLPYWKFVFGFGIFLILMAIIGVLIEIKDFIDKKAF